MKTLKELLAERHDKIKKQREIIDAAKSDERDLTDEEVKQFDDLENEIKALDGKIEVVQAQEERERILAQREKDLDEPAQQQFRPRDIPGEQPQKEKLDDGGFKNLGEFIHAVRFGDSQGRLQNLRQGDGQGGGIEVPDAFKAAVMPSFRNEWTMGTGEEGGFAVPTQFSPEMQMIQPEAPIVRSRATVIPAGDPPDSKITIPAFQQGSNGAFGGVEVYWIGEGETKPETDGKLEEINLTPQEVAAHTIVTDKLLRNWPAATSFINNLLSGAVNAAEDFSFLRGNGVAKPMGVLGAPGALKVARDTAGDIITADVVMMLAKLLPDSTSRAMWVANQSTLPKIATLQDAAGNYIFLRGDATRGIPDTLAGIPIKFTGKTPALGSEGDLMLVDFTYYLIKDGSGPFIAASEHVLFRQNKTVIKVFWNVDGQGWVKEPLTLEDGKTQVSPYVVLK